MEILGDSRSACEFPPRFTSKTRCIRVRQAVTDELRVEWKMNKFPLVARIGVTILSTTAFYGFLGQLVPQMESHYLPPVEVAQSSELDVADMVERGLKIFEGKGLCATCHTRGEGPISPAFPDLEDIGRRAAERVDGMDSLTYLSHSIYEPSSFVAPGFRAAMPEVSEPPIELTDDEIRMVIAYLQSLGSEPTVTASTALPVVLSSEQASALAAAVDVGPPAEPKVAPGSGMLPVAVEAVLVAGGSKDSPLSRGKGLFDRTCAICHGASAEGNRLFNAPRLAGQESWYVARQLANFSDGLRGTDPRDVFGQQMRPMAMAIQGEEEMADLAAYLSSLGSP